MTTSKVLLDLFSRVSSQAGQDCCPRGRVQVAPAQQFAAALKAYRAARGAVLALAKAERFDQVRVQVPQQVRPAYDLVKTSLSHLATQSPSAIASKGWRRLA